jgi:hypothetical protein
LTRTRDQATIQNLEIKTKQLLDDIMIQYSTLVISREEYVEYMSLMYRMIGHTRDIIDGKGEYTLSYMLLNAWYNVNPQLANFAFQHFLMPPTENKEFHPYGSWKDIKYMYKYNNYSPLVNYGLLLLVDQLRKDILSDNPSLAAKWVPREKSQFSNLFTELSLLYFSNYMYTAKTEEAKRRAMIKAKMDFRKVISGLNKKLDTVQIKQCGQNWATIDPSKQTSITMHKQKKAFFNLDNNGNQRSELEDRIICAAHFQEYAEKAARGEVEVKGKRIGLNDFTKNALAIISADNKDSPEATILNAQWIDNTKQTGALGKMIGMVDVSGSMDGDPLYAAIALGIRIAEKSLLGKRVLTFSANPSWVNLTGKDTFVEMVDTIRVADWGMNTNFYSAMKLILDAIIESKLEPEDVEDMVLTILSDMQMDMADQSSKSLTLMDTIEQLYADTGIRLWGKPFKAPHILFWNLRSSTGFPTLSTKRNCSMMSGFSPALLNLFCEEGINALDSCTPWKLLEKSLENERYDVLDKFIREII